jgi:hypothetical protein
MCACGECLEIVISANQVSGDREALEVVGLERYIAISVLQQPKRFGPRPLLERLPPTQYREVRHVTRWETVDRSGSRVSTASRMRFALLSDTGAC